MRNGKDIDFRQCTDQVTLDCEVDAFALGQVFRNILENAIAYDGLDLFSVDNRGNELFVMLTYPKDDE